MVTASRRIAFAVALLAIVSASAFAAKISDVKNTTHNLSATPYSAGTDTRTVKATGESQICVFCHTPHKANAAATALKAPLWNRALSGATYTKYPDKTQVGGESMDATLDNPDGSSKLCLSCHDGTMALGSVGVLNGQENVTIALSGTDAGYMPNGAGATTGYTRDLGIDLTNDHPISFTYDSALATADGELVDPTATTYIMNRTLGATHPDIPLENGKVQCVACHDPHIRDVDMAKNAKFLRLNRFQENAPNGGIFSANDDTVCLACHDKNKAGWSGSAHANPLVADELYDNNSNAVVNGDFDTSLPVWKAACLNCHDTHTVQGARRLLRAGVSGSSPALEQTCYQCHSNDGATLTSQGLNTQVPDIKSDFTLTYAMPIATTSEVHAITDKDFTESQFKLGKGDLNNRHAECTDCHNPHRVIKNRLFNADPAKPDAAGTHEHTAGVAHTNIASGVLAGTTGVEPTYGTTTWGSLPSSYTLKKGYGGQATVTDPKTDEHVTREYQVCLKCHSDYAYDTPPSVGASIGLNTVNQYTNQAMELQAPAVDKGEVTAIHRSWHPVIAETGRTTAIRGNMDAASFTAPWDIAVGTQTMYCSDCHGSDTGAGSATVVPTGGEDGNPWGPHGSSNSFILKGNWLTTGTAATLIGPPDAREICFKCHNKNNYSPAVVGTFPRSGFSQVAALGGGGGMGAAACNMPAGAEANLHIGHTSLLGELRCTWCHTAVPHGWKNKALLVDITNDLQAETGNTCNGLEPCTVGPYYQNAYLGGNGPGTNTVGGAGINWATSGNWVNTDCGGGGAGGGWMNNTCNAPQ